MEGHSNTFLPPHAVEGGKTTLTYSVAGVWGLGGFGFQRVCGVWFKKHVGLGFGVLGFWHQKSGRPLAISGPWRSGSSTWRTAHESGPKSAQETRHFAFGYMKGLEEMYSESLIGAFVQR